MTKDHWKSAVFVMAGIVIGSGSERIMGPDIPETIQAVAGVAEPLPGTADAVDRVTQLNAALRLMLDQSERDLARRDGLELVPPTGDAP